MYVPYKGSILASRTFQRQSPSVGASQGDSLQISLGASSTELGPIISGFSDRPALEIQVRKRGSNTSPVDSVAKVNGSTQENNWFC